MSLSGLCCILRRQRGVTLHRLHTEIHTPLPFNSDLQVPHSNCHGKLSGVLVHQHLPPFLPPLHHHQAVDYKGLVKAVEAMSPEEFASLDLDKLLATYSH